ncbi:hypothetical protein K435DRAFT_595733, partial [Dendrothele bispora CBS 962.96]
PPEFNGDKKKYRNWRRLCQTYLEAYADFFDYSADEERWILSYMTEGSAADWAEMNQDQIGKVNTEGFWEKLDERFLDPTLARDAADELETTPQGKKSIQEYFQWFEERCKIVGYTDSKNAAHLIRMLDNNIKSDVVDDIYSNQQVPETFSEYKKIAMSIGMNKERRERMKQKKSHWNYTMPRKQEEHKTEFKSNLSGVAAKAYSAGTGQGAPMQIDQAKQEGKCFKCGNKWGETADCARCKK